MFTHGLQPILARLATEPTVQRNTEIAQVLRCCCVAPLQTRGSVYGQHDPEENTRATRIELTPKSDELKKLVTKIELWIPEGQTNPVQEKITQPSKNYSLVKYSDLKINPTLPDSAFALTLPAKVKKIHPQK